MNFSFLSTNPTRISINGRSACCAMRLDGFNPIGITGADVIFLFPFGKALLRTKEMIVSLYFGGVTFHNLAATIARNLFHCAFVGRGEFSNFCTLPFTAARTITKLVLSAIQSPRGAVNIRSAIMALNNDSVFGGHKKSLSLDDRCTCLGRIGSNERPGKLISFRAIGQLSCALDKMNYNTPRQVLQ